MGTANRCMAVVSGFVAVCSVGAHSFLCQKELGLFCSLVFTWYSLHNLVMYPSKLSQHPDVACAVLPVRRPEIECTAAPELCLMLRDGHPHPNRALGNCTIACSTATLRSQQLAGPWHVLDCVRVSLAPPVLKCVLSARSTALGSGLPGLA